MYLQPEHMVSRLLTSQENEYLFGLIEDRCQSVATAVVQLYVTEPPLHSKWVKKHTGVLCFIKDNNLRTYFFKLYCLRNYMLLWQQEIYPHMSYTESTNFLHHFEGDQSIIAFNFSSTEEAKDFGAIVKRKVEIATKRHEKKVFLQQPQPIPNQLTNNIINTTKSTINYFSTTKTKKKKSKKDKNKKKVTKEDISNPSGFQHVQHVGFDVNNGFSSKVLSPELQGLFEKAGITENLLQSVGLDSNILSSNQDFVYQFLNDEYAEIIEPVAQKPFVLPPVPPRRVSTPQPQYISSVRTMPPPLTPPPLLPQQATNVPAPPPPPPLLPPEQFASHDRILMSSSDIQSVQLQPVQQPQKEDVASSRGDLLSEIQKGVALKKADERKLKPVQITDRKSVGADLAQALARALADRSRVTHSDSDESSDEDDDDEWEA